MSEFTTRRRTVCGCGEPLTACTDVDNHGCAPKPGDITICVYCGAILEFDNSNIARQARAETIAEFRGMAEYPAAVKAVYEYRQSHNVATPLRHPL